MSAGAEMVQNAWYLTGPTAAGKTAVGIELAKRIDAEIISLDSMALYRGMDIGTAKPTVAERRDVPHHLIDILEPSQEFSVAQYLVAAESARRILPHAANKCCSSAARRCISRRYYAEFSPGRRQTGSSGANWKIWRG